LVSAVTITDVQQPQRSSPKVSGTARRNRRKADLSLEALSYDDEDEITVPTFGAYQAPYMRRVGGPGSIVVGCSGNTPTQPPFANISVQSAQNNFSATVARQQQMLKQQVRRNFLDSGYPQSLSMRKRRNCIETMVPTNYHLFESFLINVKNSFVMRCFRSVLFCSNGSSVRAQLSN
uniref:SUZ domain-containing protein n=1 Tax=Brugia timori TaxID=42155 RepID=A0A0R3Q4F2_9BILA